MVINGPVLYLDAVLAQKVALFRALRRAVTLKTVRSDLLGGHADGKLHHPSADEVLKFQCPLLGASVGQHVRHSLDHVRKTVDACLVQHTRSSLSPPQQAGPLIVAYDERARGTAVEEHLVSAEREVASLRSCLDELAQRRGVSARDLAALPLVVRFAMAPAAVAATGHGHDGQAEKHLAEGVAVSHLDVPSNAAREMVFAAHHAIHHQASILAIVKRNEAQVAPGLLAALLDLAPDFGKAPSTMAFQKALKQEASAPLQ
jgi:hypothetical protein